MCAGGKALAVQEYRQGKLLVFKAKMFQAGHFQTNYQLWATQEEAYSIKYKKASS